MLLQRFQGSRQPPRQVSRYGMGRHGDQRQLHLSRIRRDGHDRRVPEGRGQEGGQDAGCTHGETFAARGTGRDGHLVAQRPGFL